MHVFKIDTLDLSVHLKVNQGDGLDFADADGFIEPQWSEGGTSDGDALLSIHEGNRQQSFPCILNPAKAGYAATKDGLALLVRDINRALKAAQVVEWRDDGATRSTYYDVRFARFDPAYDYRRAGQLWLPGTVKVWTKPYGNTATNRIVATGQSAGMVMLVASGIDGDTPADIAALVSHLPAGNASQFTGDRLIIGVAACGVDFCASPFTPAASMGPGGLASLIGASGAISSQAWRATVGVSVAPLMTVLLPFGLATRARWLAMIRSNAPTALGTVAAALYGVDVYTGQAVGPTVVMDTGKDWRVVDFGVVSPPPPLFSPQFWIYGAHMGATAASIDFGGALFVPEDSVVMVNEPVPATNILSGDPRAPVATYTINASLIQQNRSATNAAGYPRSMAAYQRGQTPQAPIGSAQFTAFALPDNGPQNGTCKVEIRVREKFAFSR